jgi:hypothetical protein
VRAPGRARDAAEGAYVGRSDNKGTRHLRRSKAAWLVWAVLLFAAVVGLGLLALSLVPSATLAARLLGTAGEARAGAYTQELAAFADQRLRVAALLVLAPAAGLLVLRCPFEELIAATGQAVQATRLKRPPAMLTLMLLVPTLVGLGLRIAFLGQPIRYDEALTFNEFASRPLYYGLSFYPDPNNHLLNTLLMHVSFVVLGNQPWVLRLPAFVAGALLVPATFWLGRLLYGSGAAVLAATLVAVSSYLVEYSTNARGYTLQALCFVMMLGLVVLAVRRFDLAALLLAAIVAALGAYDLPTMVYGVAIGAVVLCLPRLTAAASERWIGWRHLLASALVLGLIVALLYLPVVVVSGPDKLVGNRFVVSLSWAELGPELVGSLTHTWGFWNRDIFLPLAALLVVGFAIATVVDIRQRRLPPGLLAAVLCLALVVLQRVAPFERVWLFLLPLYFVVASAGLARFVDGRILAIVFGGVIGFTTLTSGSILRSQETGAFPEAEAVTRTLAPRLAPDDAVITQQPTSLPELQYYFPKYGLPSDVLVRPPEEAQNLWVISLPGDAPALEGWGQVQEVQRFDGATLFELKR